MNEITNEWENERDSEREKARDATIKGKKELYKLSFDIKMLIFHALSEKVMQERERSKYGSWFTKIPPHEKKKNMC